MIGIDIVEVARVQKFDIDKFADKILCDSEKEYLSLKLQKAQTLSGFFAAKEAVAKALGSGLTKDVSFKDIQILHDQSGAPICKLSGNADAILQKKGKEIFVSISHDGDYAVAVAMIK